MMKQNRDLSTWMATINFVLPIIGYTLITSLFLPNVDAFNTNNDYSLVSRTVTIPFRVMVIIVSLFVVFQNWHTKVSLRGPFGIYVSFWVLLIIRMIYDMHIRTDFSISPSEIRMQWIYTFGVCIFPAYSLAKCWKKIDLALAFELCFWGVLAYLYIQLINQPDLFSSKGHTGRTYGNIALNSISYGHSGVTIILLALATMRNVKYFWQRLLLILLIIAGFIITINAASRGPIVALVFCLLIYYYAKQKSNTISIIVLFPLFVLFVLLSDYIWEFITQMSPTMAERLSLSGDVNQYEEYTNGRSDLFAYAWNKFLENPFFGYSYGIVSNKGHVDYSHNTILDAFMATGFIGGMMYIYILFVSMKMAFNTIRYHRELSWLALLIIQAIVKYQFSGNFYESDFLQFAFVTALCILPLRLKQLDYRKKQPIY